MGDDEDAPAPSIHIIMHRVFHVIMGLKCVHILTGAGRRRRGRVGRRWDIEFFTIIKLIALIIIKLITIE